MSVVQPHAGGPPSERKDLDGFTRWLMSRQNQESPTGALARIVKDDAFWPDPQTRADLVGHLRALGVRGFIVEVASGAWTEYEQWVAQGLGKQKARARSKRAKKARRANRATVSARRKR